MLGRSDSGGFVTLGAVPSLDRGGQAVGGSPGVAVVGCGHWGQNLVRVMASLGALRGVVEKDPARQARARELAPEAWVTDDLEAAVGSDDVAGVVVAAPAEHHHRLARAALLAGKDVFVEKPLTTEVATAQDLITLAAERDAVLMVGHLLEYHPAYLKLQELVVNGDLGKLQYLVSNRLNLGKIRTEENALWSFAPHDIALMLRFVGSMPGQVVATGGSYIQPNIADVTVTQLLFDSGIRAHIFVSWLHPFKEHRLVLIGSDRMASYDDVNKRLVLYDQRVDWQEGQPVPVRGEGFAVSFDDEEPLLRECRHFLDCIGSRRHPRSDGVQGLRVLQVLEAAQRSLVQNGRPTSLELVAR